MLGGINLGVLIFISAIGIILSFIVHICLLFNIYEPPKELLMPLGMCAFIIYYPSIIFSEKIRRRFGKKGFKKAISAVCPGWMLAMCGFVIIYAIIIFAFFLLRGDSSASAVDNEQMNPSQPYKVISGFWVLLYFLAFSLFYSYRRLQERATNLPGDLSQTACLEDK